MSWASFWSEYGEGVATGVTVPAITGAGAFFLQRRFPGFRDQLLGRQIQITSPAPLQGLTDKRPLGDVFSYSVSGKLKSLPKNHMIWLLVQDEKSPRVWPQAAYRVEYDPGEGRWVGRISVGPGYEKVQIVAVVAPPTSNEFFEYFYANGSKTHWAPLPHLPVECSNVHIVPARVT
jgi:hypothetical protein